MKNKSAKLTTEYIESNGIVRVGKVTDGHRKTKIPTGVYSVKKNPQSGEFFLQQDKEKYDIGKIYGKLQNTRAKRIQKAFKNSSASVGVLLSGIKGTGKTVLLKLLANRMIEKGIPVISVNEGHYGEDFNSFIESLGECMIMFDEFTKTYMRKEEQAKLLTLFDGLNSTKRLTILTSNEPRQLNEFFFDRPGRILYHYDFRNLDPETFYGFLEDNLTAMNFREDIIKTYETSFMYTFDILKTLVHECNTNVKLPFTEIISPLNVSDLREETYYVITEIKHSSGKKFKGADLKGTLLPSNTGSISIAASVTEEVRKKKANLRKDFYWDIYMAKNTFKNSKGGIKTFEDGAWSVKLREVTQ